MMRPSGTPRPTTTIIMNELNEGDYVFATKYSDGMSEDLITDLSRISGLFVIARNSSFTYKGKAIDNPLTVDLLNIFS